MFNEKISELYHNGLTKKKVLDVLGIPRNTQLQWEKGERIPPEWQQPLILNALKNIDNQEFISSLKKIKPED